MHRLLVDTESLGLDTPELSREAANHLKVLHPRNGESFELFDGCGHWRTYRFDAATGRLGAPGELMTAAPRIGREPLTLFACVTKGSRWDWTVEKATELGVGRIVPVISERTIVRIATSERNTKRERWLRIAEDAARQSDAKWIPEILEPMSFSESIPLAERTRCLVGALTTPPPKTIGAVLAAAKAVPNAVYVGPEGDFTPAELSALLVRATPVSFGDTILRAETAAIYGISVLKAALDAAEE